MSRKEVVKSIERGVEAEGIVRYEDHFALVPDILAPPPMILSPKAVANCFMNTLAVVSSEDKENGHATKTVVRQYVLEWNSPLCASTDASVFLQR